MVASTVPECLAFLLILVPSLVSAASNITTEPAQFFPDHNSTRVKIRYGPFTAPSMDVNGGMQTFVQRVAQIPCTDCLITFMQAGLEYDNGTNANADTNFWLHHTVFANTNRASTVCTGPGNYDSFFASGNERTPVNICANGTLQAGYYLGAGDRLGMLAELMNMDVEQQSGYVTLTYEYIPAPPASFSRVKALWFDIGGCDASSDQPVKSTTQAFQYSSPQWVSTISGKVTFIGGHLHDGGAHLTVQSNNTSECDCVAMYGANSDYVGGGMAMSSSMSMSMPVSGSTSSMDMASMSMSMSMPSTTMSMSMPTSSSSSGLMDNIHISNISTCLNPSNGVIHPGDVWSITAYYDPTQHDLMMYSNGSAAPIMGISIAYVADVNVTNTTGSSATSSASASASAKSSGADSNFALRSTGWEVAVCLFAAGVIAGGLL